MILSVENVQKIDTIVMFSNWQIEAETEVNGNFRIRNVTASMLTTKARIKRVYDPTETFMISLEGTGLYGIISV